MKKIPFVSFVVSTVALAWIVATLCEAKPRMPAEQTQELNRMKVEHIALGITFDFRLNRITDENAGFLRYEFVGTGRDSADQNADFAASVAFVFSEPTAWITTAHLGGEIYSLPAPISEKKWLLRKNDAPNPEDGLYSVIDPDAATVLMNVTAINDWVLVDDQTPSLSQMIYMLLEEQDPQPLPCSPTYQGCLDNAVHLCGEGRVRSTNYSCNKLTGETHCNITCQPLPPPLP